MKTTKTRLIYIEILTKNKNGWTTSFDILGKYNKWSKMLCNDIKNYLSSFPDIVSDYVIEQLYETNCVMKFFDPEFFHHSLETKFTNNEDPDYLCCIKVHSTMLGYVETIKSHFHISYNEVEDPEPLAETTNNDYEYLS